MFYLHLRAFTKFLLVYFLFCNGILNAQTEQTKNNEEANDEILIFRTSPGIELDAEGYFKFQVSTFSPILVVKVNGFAQMVTGEKDWAEYKVPFYLKKGKNLFNIFVQTKNSQKEKKFVVNFEPEKTEEFAPPPLKGVVMLGHTISDNILNVKDGNSKTSSTKFDILFSAGYSFFLSEESDLSMSLVLKFDHYPKRSLVKQEVLFRQFSTDYKHKNILGLNFNSGIGQNVISLKDVDGSDPHKAGEFNKDLQSTFLFFSAKKKWGDFSSEFKVQTDFQNKIKNDTEDGTLMLASLSSKMILDKFRINGRLDSKTTTFDDPSKDYESTIIDLGSTFSMTPWIFGLNYNFYDQKYKKPDSATNEKLKVKKDEISIDLKYALRISTILGSVLKQIKQDSNFSDRSYTENQFLLQYIWIF